MRLAPTTPGEVLERERAAPPAPTPEAAGLVETNDAGGRVSPNRLAFLDALRGVAVLLVVAQHVGEATLPGLERFTTERVQLGQLGVSVFFLCSGFIIPAALERNASLRAFWVNRFFRLYPLYWVSLLVAGVVALTYEPMTQGLSARDWVLNVTMLQAFTGTDNAIGVYWSLAFELLFYFSMSALFVVGLHRRTVPLQVLAHLACIALAVGLPLLLDRHAPLGLFSLASMLTGTLVFRWLTGEVSRRTLALCVGLSVITAIVVVLATLRGNEDPSEIGARSVVPMLSAWIGAYLIFGAGFLAWRGGAPRWLCWVGLVSYSVYLVHSIVLWVVPGVGIPLLTSALWVAIILAASWATFRFVERPAIVAGRRLVRLRAAPARSSPAADNPI